MSIRGFLRELFSSNRTDPSQSRHHGDDVADEIRESMGPLASGGTGGHITGNAIYKKLEDEAGIDGHDEP